MRIVTVQQLGEPDSDGRSNGWVSTPRSENFTPQFSGMDGAKLPEIGDQIFGENIDQMLWPPSPQSSQSIVKTAP